jgi:hypothetical protein
LGRLVLYRIYKQSLILGVSGKLVKFINYGANVGGSMLTVDSNCFFHGEKWTDAPGGGNGQFFGIKMSASDNRDYSRIIGFFTGNSSHIYFRAIHSGNWSSEWKTII